MVAGGAAGLVMGLAGLVIFCGWVNLRAAADQDGFHLKAIGQFALQWPCPDLRDYPSATTPGYHLALAWAKHVGVADVRWLRLAGAAFSAGLIGMLAWAVGGRVGARGGRGRAILLCLPLVASLYFITSAAWLLPDNAGWWGVLAVLVLALRRRVDRWTYLLGGLTLLLLMLVRQSHIAMAAVLWVAAWLGDEDAPKSPGGWVNGGSCKRTAWMVLATLPALVGLGWFVWMWGGLTPPSFAAGAQAEAARLASGAGRHSGGNPAVPAMILAVAGAWGVFLVGWLGDARAWRTFCRRQWVWVVGGTLVGVMVAILPQTGFDPAAGRMSGFWNLGAKLPMVAGRSVLITGLAMLGGSVLGLWCAVLNRRDRILFLSAWGVFATAQCANAMAWQRYYEPFVLMMFALFAARLPGSAKPNVAAVVGTVLLTMVLAAITVASFG